MASIESARRLCRSSRAGGVSRSSSSSGSTSSSAAADRLGTFRTAVTSSASASRSSERARLHGSSRSGSTAVARSTGMPARRETSSRKRVFPAPPGPATSTMRSSPSAASSSASRSTNGSPASESVVARSTTSDPTGRGDDLSPEHARVQDRRLVRRVQSELVRVPHAEPLERLQGARPVAAGGERADQEQGRGLAQRLAERGLPGERRRPPRIARGERRLRAGLERDLECLAQPSPKRLGPVLVQVLGQWLAAPSFDGPEELGERVGRESGAHPLAPELKRREELLGVDPAPLVRRERVPAGTGDDERGVPEGAARPRDEHLQVRHRIRGRPKRPQRLDQDVLRHVLAPAGGEHPHQAPGQSSAEGGRRDLLPLAQDDEPAEEPHVERRERHRTRMLVPGRGGRNPLGRRTSWVGSSRSRRCPDRSPATPRPPTRTPSTKEGAV